MDREKKEREIDRRQTIFNPTPSTEGGQRKTEGKEQRDEEVNKAEAEGGSDINRSNNELMNERYV